MAKRPTIYDVAERAGVGYKTVSRVLNDEPYVKDETRQKVLDAITELDFRPNAAARVLRKNVSSTLAYVCADIIEPVQAEVAGALSSVAKEAGFLMTVSETHGDPISEKAVLSSLIAHQVDGIALWPSLADIGYLRRLAHGIPVVCIDQFAKGLRCDTVLSTNREGARQAVGLLLEHGHTRIAYVGDPITLSTQQERVAGYRDAMLSASIEYDKSLVFNGTGDVTRLDRQLAFWRVLPDPPTAIFSGSSVCTSLLLPRLMTVADVEVVAFDDFPYADILRGGITVVAQNVSMIGRVAGERLLARIRGERGPGTVIRIGTTLVARGG